jgi:thioredoxin-related protein
MFRLIALLAVLSCTIPATAGELGDDGLHKAPWMRDTFKDLREDLTDASAEGKRLMILVEQRGCSYCRKMHEEVFVVPNVAKTIEDNFFVVQINMFGNVEVTDFDGTTLPEKEIVKRWGALFTPNIYFFPKSVPEGQTVPQAAVANMPGAFSASTTFDLLNWVLEDGYEGEEPFQKYHARKIQERGG